MKRSLKLFNKKGKKPRRKQDIMDYEDEFTGDDFEEDYDDGYDEADYPDEEFEREYGDFEEDEDNFEDADDGDYAEEYSEDSDYRDDDYYRDEDAEYEDYDAEIYSDEEPEAEPAEEYENEPAEKYKDEPIEEYEGDFAEKYEAEPVEKLEAEPAEEYEDRPLEEYENEPAGEYEAEPVEEYEDEPDEEYEDEYDVEDEYEDEYNEEYDEDYDEDYDADEDDYDRDYEDDYDEEGVGAGAKYSNSRRNNTVRNGRNRRSEGSEGVKRIAAVAAVAGEKVVSFVKESSFVERAAAIAGILILVAALVTISFYSKALGRTREINEFAEVGTNLSTMDVVGSTGLIAVADAERARAMTAEIIVEEEEEEEVVADDAKGVTINMTLTSIKSDIKVKFINSESGKLVADLPFEIEVKNPDGTTVTYDDHDRDGIIYKKDMTAGKYTVTPKALPSDYSNYTLDTSSKTLTVKDTVEMKAVDVSNEIKKESQVNAAKEDTAVQTTVESELKDTVDWDGESYSTGGDDDSNATYEEVDKNDVDPASLSGKLTYGSIMHLSAARAVNEEVLQEENQNEENSQDNSEDSNNENGSENEQKEKLEFRNTAFTLTVGSTEQLAPTNGSGISYSSSNESVATVSSDGLITAKGPGSATITASADDYESETIEVTVEGNSEEKEEKPVEEEDEKEVPLSSGLSMTVEVGKTVNITSSDSSLKLSCRTDDDDTSIVEVKETTVKGVAEGMARVIVSCSGYEDAIVEITVIEAQTEKAKDKVPLEVTSFTIHERKTEKITAKDSSLKLSCKSDNTNVATVSDCVVTGVSAGTATITVSAEGYADEMVSVTVIHKELKDKSGNTLYVLENGKYRVAVFADYDTAEKFYKKVAGGEKKYHGWATIDGKTYFFDNSGTMVTGEQVIKGAKYTFGSDGVLSMSPTLGIDVSKWNGNIDWNKVKSSGVNYVIIRCGYRGSSAGALIEDPKFKANIKGATAAGLKVGVYFFTQAVNEVEAVEEASMCINLVKGYSLSFPIFIDVEGSNGRGDGISTSQRTANIKAFCGTIQNAGYSAGVYANKTWFTSMINTSQITGFKIWLAQYAAAVTYNASRYDMWQYTSRGSVSGITGNVDMNILYR